MRINNEFVSGGLVIFVNGFEILNNESEFNI